MNKVKQLIFAAAALVALSGLAFSADKNETIVDEPGAVVKGYTGSGTGGATVYRSYSSSGPGGVTVYRSYSSSGAGGATIYRSYSSGGTGGTTDYGEERSYGEETGSGTGGSTHGDYGIDVDTRTGGSYPGVSPDTTTGTDTSQGMGGITGGRSGSYKFGIGGKGSGGTLGTYSSATGSGR